MEDEGVLTVEKLRCINRCRLRYQAGMGVPRDDLYRLGVSVDVRGAKEVLGFWLDPDREPALEGNIALRFPIITMATVS